MKQKVIFHIAFMCCILFSCSIYSQLITSAIPNSVIPGQTIDIIIKGTNTHFRQGVTVVDLGPGISVPVTGIQVQNNLLLTAAISVSPTVNIGLRDIKVTTGNEVAIMSNGFEVYSISGAFRTTLEVLPVQSLSLGDIDPSNFQNSPNFFWVNIYNNNSQRTLKVEVSLSSAKLGQLGLALDPSVTISPNQVIRLDKSSFPKYVNNPTATAFYKQVLASGSFPPDDYTYTVKVIDQKTGETVSDSSVTTITNVINNPELILPGASFSDPEQTIYLNQPLFQWFGQNNQYDFGLYMIMPGQTPEEAVRNIPVYKTSGIKTTSFLYPNFAEKLIDGKEYAWQITAGVSTVKGTNPLYSEVFRFLYRNLQQAGSDNSIVNGASSIKVFPQQINLSPGQQFQFSATVFDANNQVITKPPIIWTVTPDGKATVDTNGIVTAGTSGGTFALIAKCGNLNDYSTVTLSTAIPSAINPMNDQDWLIGQMIKQLFGLPK